MEKLKHNSFTWEKQIISFHLCLDFPYWFQWQKCLAICKSFLTSHYRCKLFIVVLKNASGTNLESWLPPFFTHFSFVWKCFQPCYRPENIPRKQIRVYDKGLCFESTLVIQCATSTLKQLLHSFVILRLFCSWAKCNGLFRGFFF